MHLVREPPTLCLNCSENPIHSRVNIVNYSWAKVLKEKVLANSWLMFAYGREIKARAPLDKEGLWKGFQGKIGRLNQGLFGLDEELLRFEIHFDISRQIRKPQPFRTFDHSIITDDAGG